MTSRHGELAWSVSPSLSLAAKHQMTDLHIAPDTLSLFPSFAAALSFTRSPLLPTKLLVFLALCPVGSVLLSQSCLALLSCPLVFTPSAVGNLPPTPQQPSLSHSTSLFNVFSIFLLPLFFTCGSVWAVLVILYLLPKKWSVPLSFPLFFFLKLSGMRGWSSRSKIHP